jgi:hypothetical protein
MNTAQNDSNCINIPLSQTFKSYVPNWLLLLVFYNTVCSWTMYEALNGRMTHNLLEVAMA